MADAGDGKVVDCVPAGDKPIIVDADIMGTGVIVAFFATATLTIFAIVIAYLSNAIDKNDFNLLDLKVNSLLHRGKRRRKSRAAIDLNTADDVESKSGAILQLILSFSDQQLVTGLAILIAGISRQQQLSGYESSVIAALAWFSCTTHLATLDALRSHLAKLGPMRHVRVFAMITSFGFLGYLYVASYMLSDNTVALACLYRSSDLRTTDNLITVINVVVLGAQLTIRIIALYSANASSRLRMKKILWQVLERRSPEKLEDGALEEGEARYRFALLDRIAKSTGLRRRFSVAELNVRAYNNSLLSHAPDIAYSFASGLSQVAYSAWASDAKVTSEAKAWTFGQITAVLLVLLPFLAAGETLYSYRYEKQHRSTTPAATAQTTTSPETTIFSPANAELLYERNSLQIRKYFPRECRQLDTDTSQPKDEILRCKQALLVKYKWVQELESETYGSVDALFLVQVRLSLAVLAASLSMAEIGIVLTALYVTIETMFVVWRAFDFYLEVRMCRIPSDGSGHDPNFIPLTQMGSSQAVRTVPANATEPSSSKQKKRGWTFWRFGGQSKTSLKRTQTVLVEEASDTSAQ